MHMKHISSLYFMRIS